MSTTKSKPTKKSCVKDHWLTQAKPSEYTYADLSNFHRTVIAILTHKKPDRLSLSELTTVMNFVYTIIDLIDSPQIFNYGINANKQIPSLYSSPFPYPKIQGLGTVKRSKKCLSALISWMREVITIEDLTLEILLDEYYSNFPYSLKPSVIPKGRPVNPHPLKNKNKSSGKL
jgi:hypothetical protein